MPNIDYRYSLEFLIRINSLIERSPFKEFFLYNDQNLLQSAQASIFSDIKVWTKERKKLKHDNKFNIKLIFMLSFMLTVSFLSLIYCLVSRKKVVVFTGDKLGKFSNDYRLDSLYGALKDIKTPYMEIVHTVPGKETLLNFIKRGRPIMYLECLDFLTYRKVQKNKTDLEECASKIDFSEFDEKEKELAKSLIIKYASSISIFKLRLKIFSLVFSLIEAEKLFTIDDVRHYYEILLSAKENDIKSFAIQHGHFTKYHVGWLGMTKMDSKIIRPDKIIVWSEYWKNELLRLGTYFSPEEIVVGGGKGKTVFPLPEMQNSNKVVVLIPYEADSPKEEVKRYILSMIDGEYAEVVFKLRMGIPKESQIEEYGLSQIKERISFVYSVEDIFSRVNVVVGTYSTFLYDMLELGKPVGILRTSLDYGEGMIVNGLASEVREVSLKDDLDELVNMSKEQLDSRVRFLRSENGKSLRTTLGEIISNK